MCPVAPMEERSQLLHWVGESRLTASIFFSPSSATQGHQPFTVFCSKRDTNHSGWKVSSSRSREHFSAVLAGLGMRLRSSCKAPAAERGISQSPAAEACPAGPVPQKLAAPPSASNHGLSHGSKPSNCSSPSILSYSLYTASHLHGPTNLPLLIHLKELPTAQLFILLCTNPFTHPLSTSVIHQFLIVFIVVKSI